MANRRQKIKEAVYKVNALRKAVKEESQKIKEEREQERGKEETPQP